MALPPWLLAGWVLGLIPLTFATWGLTLGCELGLAWTQGRDYPPLGPWSALLDAHTTRTMKQLEDGARTLRRRIPGDLVGCTAVLAGPVAVVLIFTAGDWVPALGATVMLGAAGCEVAGAVVRTRNRSGQRDRGR